MVNLTLVKFEVDNGANLTLINKLTYLELWPNEKPNWNLCSVSLSCMESDL